MREHKYRAWDKFTKKIVFEGFNVIGEVTCFNLLDQYGDAHPNPIYETSTARLNDFILMQFTGLKDKNGKEIYESDLILWRDKVWIIAWRERAAGFGLFVPSTYEHEQGKRLLEKHFCGREKDYERIGNIYENPELLK